MSGEVWFISGIDTGIGKTAATGWLAVKLACNGASVITQKMVQTGCQDESEDIVVHRRIQKIELIEDDKNGITCPYLFDYPCSPHLAAKMSGQTIDWHKINQATAELAVKYDYVLLEGAGGLAVPLNDTQTTLDFVAQQGYPVVLVTSGRLGSINHTLLSLMACRQYDIEVKYLIYNRFGEKDELIERDTAAYLQHYLQQNFAQTRFEWMDEV